MNQISTIGIIGGSGVYNIEGVNIIKEHVVETVFGKPSGNIIEAELEGVKFLFIPRHGRDHSILPHEVNYRANVFALKELGVEYLVSISAVGSLKEELPPTTFVLPDQFIDWTKGKRERSFFGNGIVAHVSTAVPIETGLQSILERSCKQVGVNYYRGGSYICIEGPQFSSKAESEIYRGFGASVIGMTNVPEAYLAKEAGMSFATMAMVTDFDCWKEVHCAVDEIMKVMKTNNRHAQDVLKCALPLIASHPPKFNKENKIGIMTPIEKLTKEQKYIVETLVK